MLTDVFDKTKPHRCPLGHPNPEACPCASCDTARRFAKSGAALKRATEKNFASTGSLVPAQSATVEPVQIQETSREKIERQRQERMKQS
ncbi:cytotoxin, partial [Vibrio sp. DBSS07]|nr:cytotoxin [Vibrio paucivorans]